MKSKLTFIHALSPLHAGTGQGVGVIDLPIAREKATNIPYLPGSSIKGSLRDEFNPSSSDDEAVREQKVKLQNQIFGPEDASFAGAIQFTDQTLLCLPIRSLAGTFAYVTSPYILKRLKRDAESAEIDVTKLVIPTIANKDSCVIASNTLKIIVKDANNQNKDVVVLEDIDLTPTLNPNLTDWFKDNLFVGSTWQAIFDGRFCVVHDDIFSFLLQTSTQIMTRIKIDDNSKTTSDTGLWYEEALPTESILFGLALAFPNEKTQLTKEKIFENVSAKLTDTLQFGGNATVGRGLCQVYFAEVSGGTRNANS